MQLLIDVGNSRTKFCCYENGEFSRWRSLKNKDFARRAHYLLPKQVKKVVLGCVHHNKHAELITRWADKKHIPLIEVKSEIQAFGVTNGYQNPEQLGVDRWLALLGAAKAYPKQHCIIVDSGTATTIDILTAQGEHLGGWIVPGIHTMVKSLLQRTSKVNVSLNQVKSELNFAQNTQQNVNAGALASTIGAIQLAEQQIAQQYDQYQVLLTGGSSKIIRQYLAGEQYHFEPNLVFLGLSCYAESHK